MKQRPLGAELFLISSRTPKKSHMHIYQKAFKLWENVWLSTMSELEGTTKLHSDAFTRTDFFGAIFIGDTAVGLCCFEVMDMTVESHRRNSWFAPWCTELLDKLAGKATLTLIPSWLTVHPEFRKSAGFKDYDLTLLLSELISLVCLDIKAEIAFGTPRVDRSVNKSILRAGATCVSPGVLHHGVLVDLVAFYPERLRTVDFSREILLLWKNIIDLRFKPKEQEQFYEADI